MKLKRSKLNLMYIFGAIFGALIAICIQRFSPDLYGNIPSNTPFQNIFGTWKILSMLNTFIIFISGTIIYSNEYEHNGIKKMRSLPINEITPFIYKILIVFIAINLVSLIQLSSMFIYTMLKNGLYDGLVREFLLNYLYSVISSISLITITIFLNSLTRNIWIPLGLNIIAFFITNIMSQDLFAFKLVPYAMYQEFSYYSSNSKVMIFSTVSIAVTIITIILKIILINTRREKL